ncbi:MAG TPA: DUF308 domain-containing protein [Chloroflexota bacterium]|nr:DUF308 domain-containing protein [Chloroflexota bacterium]
MVPLNQPLYRPTTGTAWLLIVIGALAIIAGILAVIFPGLTLLTLVLIFGWYAIIAGLVEIFHAFTGNRTTEGRILLGIWGLVTLAICVIALVVPGITLGAFVLLVAAFFIITGVAQVLAAFRGHLHGWLLVWGILGIAAGILAVVYPGIAALTLAVIFAVYAILGGISAVMGGIHILRNNGEPTSMPFGHARAG